MVRRPPPVRIVTLPVAETVGPGCRLFDKRMGIKAQQERLDAPAIFFGFIADGNQALYRRELAQILDQRQQLVAYGGQR